MKRLFQLVNVRGNVALNDDESVLSFEDKASAKKERDTLNEDYPKDQWRVAPGPDHRNYS